MAYIIVKPTSREREERLAESRTSAKQRNVEGVVRRTEEAFEIERARAREGKPFDRPYEVKGESPEAKQAEAELMSRAGFKREDIERYQVENERQAG